MKSKDCRIQFLKDRQSILLCFAPLQMDAALDKQWEWISYEFLVYYLSKEKIYISQYYGNFEPSKQIQWLADTVPLLIDPIIHFFRKDYQDKICEINDQDFIRKFFELQLKEYQERENGE